MNRRILEFVLILTLLVGLSACGSSSTITEGNASEEPTLSKEEYKASCVEIPYETLARDPESNKGTNIVVRGQIVQTLENEEGGLNLRVDTGTDGDGWYEDTVYITYQYKEGELRFLENDVVTIYGVYEGLHTYQSVFGSDITIPWIEARYIELDKKDTDPEEDAEEATDAEQSSQSTVESESTEEDAATRTEKEFRPLEYSSKYGGSNIQGFYVTEETASDYFVNNYDSLRSFDTMEEFIDFKYSNIIFDFYVTEDPYPGDNVTEVTLCMKDDYGWSYEDFERIATDIMSARSVIPEQTYFTHVTFEFYDGDSLYFDSYYYYTD